jgi:Uma2 family endonuclease
MAASARAFTPVFVGYMCVAILRGSLRSHLRMTVSDWCRWCYIETARVFPFMNIASTHTAEDLPPRRVFTVEDIRRMIDVGVIGEDERTELIEGDIVILPPKTFGHELIKTELTLSLMRAVPEELFAGVATTLQFSDDILVDADFAIVPHADYKPSRSGFAQPTSILLVIEIADLNLAYDRDFKARLYARHGIREFWVVDANERVTWIHTGPSGDGWTSVVERGADETLTTSALPNLAIRLSDID